ncbi:hypothetical protein [Streptomyces sp. NPDC007172]|uniref:hypothetical protein n=1 Tax=Streptomyces sp. NPDC007172 TaxID=3364776 RepID=UPI0036CD4D97
MSTSHGLAAMASRGGRSVTVTVTALPEAAATRPGAARRRAGGRCAASEVPV